MMKLCVIGMLITALLSPLSAQTPMFIGPNGPVDLRDHDLMSAGKNCTKPGCGAVYARLLQERRETRFYCASVGVFMSDRERNALRLLCGQVTALDNAYADGLTDGVI